MPGAGVHVPQVRAAGVGDVDRRNGTKQQRGEEGRHERHARRGRPVVREALAEAKDLRAAESLRAGSVVSAGVVTSAPAVAATAAATPLRRSGTTYVVCLAAGDARKLGRATGRRLKGVALGLRAGVLPVGAVRMRERGTAVRPGGQLLDERPGGVEVCEQRLRLAAPKDGAVLHAGTADAGDARQVAAGITEAREHELQRLHPHGGGCEDLAARGVREDALADAVFGGEGGVEVDDGGVGVLEVRGHDEGCA